MLTLTRCIGLAAAAALGLMPLSTRAQAAVDAVRTPVPLRSIEEATTITIDGRAQPLRVAIRQWSLVSGREIERFPIDGDVLVHLRAGQITTLIGGQRQERIEGDFWLVSTDTPMSVIVKTEMATLETVSAKR